MDHSDPSGVVGVDVGSKYCHLRELLAEKGLQCYRLDVCPREDKRGMVVGNGRRIPFKDYCLDFMVTSHVLAHIDILVEFLSEASRVLKPRGRLYILQSNGLGWWKFWGYYIVRNDRKAPFRTFT